ncbi:hypothetical protein EDB86DRAFT_2880066 [Lactarius hatsudake]|nr:hypothetical protein EDB86DRAFT_2880066 [Lactarius hatsudake]
MVNFFLLILWLVVIIISSHLVILRLVAPFSGGAKNTRTSPLVLPVTMVAYCPTALAGGTCTDGPCTNRHDISRYEPCGCSFPASLLGQHRSRKKHLRNVAANGTTNSVTTHQPPLPTNLQHPQPMSLPSASSPAIGIQNPI